MDALLIVGIVLLWIAVLLLIHHKRKHSRYGNDYISDPCRQWFQPEDVCNAHCAHEKWVVLFAVAGIVFVVLGAFGV